MRCLVFFNLLLPFGVPDYIVSVPKLLYILTPPLPLGSSPSELSASLPPRLKSLASLLTAICFYRIPKDLGGFSQNREDDHVTTTVNIAMV